MSRFKIMGKTAVLNKFSRNLKRIRKTMKMNQTDFAQLIKVSKTSVSNYENRKSAINRETLVRMCNSLDDEMTYKLFENM